MSGKIPQAFIDELLNRTDIVDIVGSRVRLKKTGSNYSGLCPFHNEKTPSFTVSQSKQFYHCFGCGAHGSAIGFLMEHERMEFPEAVEDLARQIGLEVPREVTAAQPQAQFNTLYELMDEACTHYEQALRNHTQKQSAVDYLKNRGLTGETAKRFRMGFAPAGWHFLTDPLSHKKKDLVSIGLAIEKDDGECYDRFRDRIMFPIRDRRGRIIAFGGRVLGNDTPKYLNSPETPIFHKGTELYGLFEAMQAQRHPDSLLVVEGYMDVVMLAQQGINNAVATLGTATSKEHVRRLLRSTSRIIFCFDGDKAGRQAAMRALENSLSQLREGAELHFLFLPEGEDPDSMVQRIGADAFRKQLSTAMPLTTLLIEQAQKDLDISSIDGRSRFLENLKPLLQQIPDSALRTLLIEEISHIAKTQPSTIAQLFFGNEPQPSTQPTREEVAPRKNSATTTHRTPLRIAMALLLAHPKLAEKAERAEQIGELDVPGARLFSELVAYLRARPNASLGAILEAWRGTEHEKSLTKLATWDHLVPANGEEAEFVGILAHLNTLIDEKRLQYLNMKLEKAKLAPEELREWQSLTTKKRDIPSQ